MSPRRITKTIPSAFIRQDTNTNATNSFCNAHDMMVARQNHNILLAQRVRKDLVAQTCWGVTDYCWTLRSLSGPRTGSGDARFVRMPLYVTQGTKEIKFNFFATKTLLASFPAYDPDPEIYVVLSDIAAAVPTPSLTNGYSVTVTDPEAADPVNWLSVDVPVPPMMPGQNYHYGRRMCRLDLYVKCYVDTTALAGHSAMAFTDVGPNWFVGASAAGFGASEVGRCVFVDTDLANEPRKIIKQVDMAGGPGPWKYFLDTHWGRVPDPNSDTLTIREILGVRLYNWGAHEKAITDFSAGVAL